MAFPKDHWRQIHSTNPLERVYKEIRCRTKVVGIFPNEDAIIRLVGAILTEQRDPHRTERRVDQFMGGRPTLRPGTLPFSP
jgi:putative transposase